MTDELEPYYDQYEKMFGIAGKAGNLRGEIQPGANPLEGSRSPELPRPPVKIGYGPSLFREACEQIGYKPFPQLSGNSPATYENPDGMRLGACNCCGFGERFGCHVGAKTSPIVTVIPNALASGRVEVRQFANAFRSNHTDGRATSVSYYDANGLEQEQPADLIVLGAWTLENVRLLPLSKIGQPYDPQTGKGVVGKNDTYQTGGAGATVWYDARTLNRFMGSGANGFAIDEYSSDNVDHSGLGFLGGGNIACSQTGARPILGSGHLPPGAASWGSQWNAAVKEDYNRSVNFGMQGESPAYRQHFIDLDPTYRDAWGNTLLRITFNWTDNERKMVKYVAEAALTRILTAMGGAFQDVRATITDYTIVPYRSTYLQGRAIMGADPSTSVVNKYSQVWDMPNLFVVGAANSPRNAGYNPTRTVGALAYTTADAIVARYLPSPGPVA